MDIRMLQCISLDSRTDWACSLILCYAQSIACNYVDALVYIWIILGGHLQHTLLICFAWKYCARRMHFPLIWLSLFSPWWHSACIFLHCRWSVSCWISSSHCSQWMSLIYVYCVTPVIVSKEDHLLGELGLNVCKHLTSYLQKLLLVWGLLFKGLSMVLLAVLDYYLTR